MQVATVPFAVAGAYPRERYQNGNFVERRRGWQSRTTNVRIGHASILHDDNTTDVKTG